MDDPTCPCEDGLPDPCTLCGEPADGTCLLDTLIGWKHRAEIAEARLDSIIDAIGDPDELRWHRWHCDDTVNGDDLRELLVRIADAADPDNRSEA